MNDQRNSAHPSESETLCSTQEASSRQSKWTGRSSAPSRSNFNGVSFDSVAKVLRFGDASNDPAMADAKMTLRDGQASKKARAAMISTRNALSESRAKKMVEFIPELPAEHVAVIRRFVEDAVTLALPKTTYAVETLLRPSTHFAYWAVFVVGIDQDATLIFNRELIEHYVRETMPKLTEGTRRNYRSWLFRVAEAVNPEANPRNPMPLNERALDEPYNPEEI